MWTGRECVFRSRCSRYSEICPFFLCFCSFPLSRLKSHEPKTSASASAPSQITADRDVVYRRHQERWCRKWAVWLLFVLLLYYFIKNSAEQCEHVSNWWTLPFLLVLYTITHTHTHVHAHLRIINAFLLFWTLEPVCLNGSTAAEKTFVIRLHVFVVVVVEVQNNGRQSGASSHHPLLLENGKQKHWNVKAFFK